MGRTVSAKKKELKALCSAQQGELDGVAIYKALSRAVKDKTASETFLRLAADEGRHAAILHRLTGEHLTPKKWKATGVVILYRLLGEKVLFPIIANTEYAAKKSYTPLAARFPEINDIIGDEIRHGDTVQGLLRS